MKAGALVDLARDRGLRIVTAESCTGGLVAAELTAVPGSSLTFERGFVTYANAAKVEMLGVSSATLETHGAVSEAVALEMVRGALFRSAGDIAVSVTGIAGPGGGSEAKPVGLVWFGYARMYRQRDGSAGDDTPTRTVTASSPVISRAVEMRYGDLGRAHIRERSVETALALLALTFDL